MLTSSVAPLAVAVLSVVVLSILWTQRARRSHLPPGPPPLPILGNLLDIPRKLCVADYQPLADKYGDVVYLDAVTQSIVVLGTYAGASELLDKRSSRYSDRPSLVMASLIGGDWLIPYSGYTDLWRQRRKRFHEFFSATAIRAYAYAQEAGARELVRLLLSAPEKYFDNVEFAFGSTIFSSVYGIDISSPNDEYLVMADEVMRIIKEAYTPGKFLVEVFPWMRHVPAWLPGMGFKRKAAEWSILLQEMRNKAFDAAFDKARRGDISPCVLTAILDKGSNQRQLSEDEEALARDVCGVAYLGASQGSSSTFFTFLYAMALHPDVQRRAQAEIDIVVGPSRLPLMSDRPALPYIDALVNECLRWMPTAQLGVPHRSMADDEYNGYLIPKGTLVLTNTRAIGRSKEHYVDPDEFRPERFLKDGQLNRDILSPRAYAFGFGRRICPGMHFGEASLFITVASVLHALTIKPGLDAHGGPTLPSSEDVPMKDGFLTYVSPCIIVQGIYLCALGRHPEVSGYVFEARSQTNGCHAGRKDEH
ncbi:cytochrome P450 [Lentinus brumalis]|uniref:Cytochrome P450 n=1 Tax=Lentinus brumalis TaxID=2498619 RepID=A0A371CPI7_9APHY|nr:cytochrome P450 [Polyporus brumalis]